MSRILSLPPETRVQICQELVSLGPHSVHLGPPFSSRLVCYSDHNVNTGILSICRQMYEEAKSNLFTQSNYIASKLYIYLISSRTEARDDIRLALKIIPSLKQFQSIKTSNLEVAWSLSFPLYSENQFLAAQNCLHLLRNQWETIRAFVLRIKKQWSRLRLSSASLFPMIESTWIL